MHDFWACAIVQELQFSRLLWSAFLHADEMHLFYNMSSLLWKVGLQCMLLLRVCMTSYMREQIYSKSSKLSSRVHLMAVALCILCIVRYAVIL